MRMLVEWNNGVSTQNRLNLRWQCQSVGLLHIPSQLHVNILSSIVQENSAPLKLPLLREPSPASSAIRLSTDTPQRLLRCKKRAWHDLMTRRCDHFILTSLAFTEAIEGGLCLHVVSSAPSYIKARLKRVSVRPWKIRSCFFHSAGGTSWRLHWTESELRSQFAFASLELATWAAIASFYCDELDSGQVLSPSSLWT